MDDTPVFEGPLVGFTSTDDPLIPKFKEAVGSFHLSPHELWQQVYPGNPPEKISVISWILPFTKRIIDSNRHQHFRPSIHWGHARLTGEILNNNLRSELTSFLNEHGYRAVAAGQSQSYKVFWNSPAGPTSNWSERHYSLAAGLGTFGLNDGLITEKGQAIRCGSVVTNLNLQPTEKKFKSHTEYCPFLERGGCGECIKRCPIGCISPKGKNNAKCFSFLSENSGRLTSKYFPEKALRDPRGKVYGRLYFCGLCHTGVPCEDSIPP